MQSFSFPGYRVPVGKGNGTVKRRKKSEVSAKAKLRKVGKAVMKRRGGSKAKTNYTLSVQLTNKSGMAIAEFWMGHNPGSSKAPSTTFHFRIADKVKPIANGAVFTNIPDITLASSSTDKWMFYWSPAINNDLIGLNSQWFSAEVQHQNGTVNLNLNPPGGDLQIQQNGKTIKSQATKILQEPAAALSTDIFASNNYGTTIDGMFKQAGLSPPSGQINLGVCLSGGGTRAMCAGMGQLQALATIQYNGKSLLSCVKAISSVSGGGWVSAPYTYLNGATSDANFLNTYVPPSQLSTTPSKTAADIGYLPPGNIGQAVTSGNFSLTDVIAQFLVLLYTTHRDSRYSKSLIWQTLVGRHMLAPYGLYIPGAYWRPAMTYSYSADALARYASNAQMAPANFYANIIDANRPQRPFHIANMSMKVQDSRGIFATLAAATPLYTGMFGNSTTGATTENGIPLGEGGIATFAFNSATNQKAAVNSRYDISQVRQWGLSDSVGVSSAFLAAVVWLYLKEASQEEIYTLLAERGPQAARFLDGVIPHHIRDEIEAIAAPPGTSMAAAIPVPWILMAVVVYELIQALRAEGDATVPHYFYWPPISDASQWPAKDSPNILPGTLITEFADGGLLENLGLASLLSFEDINAALVFVNTAEPLAAGPNENAGVVNQDGSIVPNTNIIVDESIAALFGYQQIGRAHV